MSKFDELYDKKDEVYAEELKEQAKEDLRLQFDTSINNAKRQVTDIKREIRTMDRNIVSREDSVDLVEYALKDEDLREAEAILERLENLKTDFLG